jgi:hypothetical protein
MWALMQESALAHVSGQFVRVKGGLCINKIVHFYSPLLYMLAIY